jgi:hypothetical protein
MARISYIQWNDDDDDDDDDVSFVLEQHAELDFYSATLLKQQCPPVDISLHSDTLFWFRANQSLLLLLNAAYDLLNSKQPMLTT